MSNQIPNEKLKSIKEDVIEEMTNTEQNLQNNLLYSFGDNYIIILTIYDIITNIYFRLIITVLCIINLVILCWLEKYEILKSIRNISIILTIALMIILIIIKLLSNFIVQKLAGGWLQDINVNALIISIVMFAIISVLLILINKNIKVGKR